MADALLFAVTGRPIMHSLSPQMHNAAFEALGMDAIYVRLASGSAKEALFAAKALGLRGMNVTTPFKMDFAKLVDGLADSARKAGAVNTVMFEKGRAVGHNTDIAGVRGALEGNGIVLSGKKAVVLGAGGAAKAAAIALIEAGASVTIANRTAEKAEELAAEMRCGFCSHGIEELGAALRDAGVIVSCISGTGRIVAPELLRRDMAVLDANYTAETALCADAKKAGCKVIGGREWLLHQGIRVFEIFTGKKAPVAAMRRAACSEEEAAGEKKNIALIGMMGTGKSTVAMEIAKLAGMKAVDIDAEIERREGKINKIFEKRGEAAFRGMERAEIAKLNGVRDCVIACGGGAVLDAENVEMLGRNCSVTWLFASAREMEKRVGKGRNRPLLGDGNRLDALERLLLARLPAYAKACDLAVCTEGKSASDCAKLILDEIRKTV
jgi:shikimate dehydrogenase